MTRIRRSLDRRDAGFTLIELLVVIIIIGILAAIAIPVFLNQRQKAHDAAAKSDLHNAALAEEDYFAANGSYADIATVDGQEHIKLSKGTTIVSVFVDKTKGFCLGSIQNGGSAAPPTETALSATVIWWYDSQSGGLQPRNIPITANYGCPGTNPTTSTILSSSFNYATNT
jgi:prepilin-type N-terminal cleavage/methylation domain-containing protein